MRTHLYGRWPLLVAAVLGSAVPSARPDEATLRDGRRLSGILTLREKQWHFLPAGKAEPLPVSSLQAVRLEARPCPPFRAGCVHRVTLRNGERLTGILLGLDDKHLALRTAWSDKLSLPRAAVAAIAQQPGWALVFLDDFKAGLKGWKAEGKPEQTPGAPGLVLNAPGQAADYTPAVPLEEGRAAITFRDIGATAGATWLAEAEFRTPAGPRLVTVTVGGAGPYQADVPGIAGISVRVVRAAGPHRLTVQFTPTSLRVLVDDAVLWHSLKHGPGGPLVKWRLLCRKIDGQLPRGRVSFEDFALHRAVAEPRRPSGDPSQDEVWLLSGDQLFGRVLRADGRSVVLAARFGRRTLPWTAVRGIYLRRQADPARPATAGRVRLAIDNGADAEPDRLEGVVLSLDERRCRLRHALFGELELARGRVVRIQWP